MSLETWKKAHYPVRAIDARIYEWSLLKCIQHSLTKWRGLKPVALKRHGLILDGMAIVEAKSDEHFPITSSTCTLCQVFFEFTGFCEYSYIHPNRECPLIEEGIHCDIGEDSPYNKFKWLGDVYPMIRLLERAERREKIHTKKQEKSIK